MGRFKTSMLLWETHAYTNRLCNIPPEQKVVFAGGTLLFALLAQPLVQGLVFLWMSVLLMLYARIPWKTYGVMLVWPCAFLLPGLLPMTVSWTSAVDLAVVEDEVLAGWRWGAYWIYVSRAGVAEALATAVRAVAATSCLYFVLLTVPFGQLLQVLRRWRMPVLVTELLLVMFRSVFVLLWTAGQIRMAQLSRGGNRGFRHGMRDLGRLIVRLFVRVREHTNQWSLGLLSRGYGGQLHVVGLSRGTTSPGFVAAAAAGWTALLLLEWQLRMGWP